MKEITYKCDICKEKGNKSNIVPFYINGNKCIQFLIELDSSNNHMCNECIETIWEYNEQRVEDQKDKEKEG